MSWERGRPSRRPSDAGLPRGHRLPHRPPAHFPPPASLRFCLSRGVPAPRPGSKFHPHPLWTIPPFLEEAGRFPQGRFLLPVLCLANSFQAAPNLSSFPNSLTPPALLRGALSAAGSPIPPGLRGRALAPSRRQGLRPLAGRLAPLPPPHLWDEPLHVEGQRPGQGLPDLYPGH